MLKAFLFINIVLLIFLVGCTSPVATQPTATVQLPTKTIVPTLTSYPTAIVVTAAPQTVTIEPVYFVLLENGKVGIAVQTKGLGGVGITLRVSYNTSPNNDAKGQWVILKEDGLPAYGPENWPVWDTSSLSNGTYLIKVEAKTPKNPNWENAVTRIEHYNVVK